MANYNKQFNFRNGIQVDDDNLVVSPTGLVGIGTTIPTEILDVRGDVKVSGFATASELRGQTLVVSGEATIDEVAFTSSVVGAGVSISSGFITATDSTGIVTYYGDATYLQGMPTSQWIDIDAGLGFTSIYNRGFVGVATDDPRFTLQIGGNTDTSAAGFADGVGISSTGNVLATGIVTALSFVGKGEGLTTIDASNITLGTISNDRLPIIDGSKIPNNFRVTGIITAGVFKADDISAGIITATTNFVGDVTGTASTALSLNGTPNVIVGIVTASAIQAGIITATTNFVGDVTGTATTASSLTSDAAVDIEDLSVGIATVNSFIGIGTDYLTGSLAIGGITNASGNDIFINKGYDRAGIGSTTTNSANASIKLWSDLGESTITIGTSESNLGSNAQIRYGNRTGSLVYSNDQSLDIINNGSGNINSYLQSGSSGIGTGSFFWHKGVNRLMALTYEGNLGIGKTDPTEKLNVQGTSFFGDAATFDDNVTINGNLTATFIGNLSDSLGSVVVNVEDKVLEGNVNVTTGISTFNNVSVGSTIDTDYIFAGLVTERSSDQHVISVNTRVEDRFFVNIAGGIGISTSVDIEDSNIGVNAIQKQAVFAGVGLGTTTPRCAADFADAGTVGVTTTHRYFLPPKVGTTDRNGIGVTETGATIYNTDLNKLQVYTGSAWETLTSS